jgi:dTDP-4-amino-4,6-dideoxygalactose transaminase
MGSSRTEGEDGRKPGLAVTIETAFKPAARGSSAMAVPLLDLNVQNLALEEELKAAFERVLRSGQFILGPEVESLEAAIAAMVGVRHGIGVSSGTDAILLALMTLGIGAGDEVICPTFTFFATAGCVARVGAKPVFVDSCPTCFNLRVDEVGQKITPKTKAIIPVHLFGQPAELDHLLDLARAHDVAVIEDAAQSLGAEYKERPVGGLGSFGIFSFFPSKNLGGFGDGGIVVTNDDELGAKARSLRAHGASPKYYHKYIGGNFRLDPLQAALLSVKLPHYQEYTAKRRANAAYYTDKLSQLSGVAISGGAGQVCGNGHLPGVGPAQPRLILPGTHEGGSHIWNQYTLRVLGDGQRDSLRAVLKARRIGTEIYYPVPMHQQECFSYLEPVTLPTAEALATQCLSLPIYPELSREQQDEVITAVRGFLEH